MANSGVISACIRVYNLYYFQNVHFLITKLLLFIGEQIKKGKGSTRVYPEPLSNFGSYESRSMEQHQRDLQVAQCYHSRG